MKQSIHLLFFVICFFNCSANNTQKTRFKEINLSDSVKITFPITKDYNENLTYMNIQIWVLNQKVFEDTTETEYLFDDKEWPKVIRTSDGSHLLYLKIFDAPDFNKLYQYTISNSKILKTDVLPYFYQPAKEIDGKKISYGILNIAETPCNNCDSCYYNPQLYYQFTENGILLDSTLTIKMNTEKWKGFYGFNQRNDIIRPCK